MVFEPMFAVTRSLTNGLGRLDLNVQGQGFVFTEHPEFNHGTLRLQAIRVLSSATRVQAHFSYASNQFLGDNEDGQSDQDQLTVEKWVSYICSTCLIRDVTPDLGD